MVNKQAIKQKRGERRREKGKKADIAKSHKVLSYNILYKVIQMYAISIFSTQTTVTFKWQTMKMMKNLLSERRKMGLSVSLPGNK